MSDRLGGMFRRRTVPDRLGGVGRLPAAKPILGRGSKVPTPDPNPNPDPVTGAPENLEKHH